MIIHAIASCGFGSIPSFPPRDLLPRPYHYFCDRILMISHAGEKDSREDIEKVFKLFDDDNPNKISFRNLARVAEELGENIDDEELQDMINQADRDGDGEINIDEFYRIMKKKGNFLEDMSSDDDF